MQELTTKNLSSFMRIYNFCELHDEDYREIFHKGKLCVRTK